MIYSSIDIGSDTIKIVVGKIDNNSFHVLAAVNTKSVGIKKGMIIDKDLVAKSILLATSELEKKIGFKIDKAVINVPFYNVSVDLYEGCCYPDGLITGDDVITCFKSCVSTIDVDLEVITVFPIDFTIDDEEKTNDPKGKSGNKLTSRMLISTIPKQIVYPYLEVLEKCGIEVIDLSFGVINDYYNLSKNDDILNSSGAIIDIGHDKTEIGIFNKGLLVKGDVLPIGSRLVDNDISYIYHLDKVTSRNIKENFAFVSSQYAKEDEAILYDSIDGEKIRVSQQEVSQVVEARVEEILKNVKKALNDLTNRKISYIIILGGISNSPGFDYLIGNIFGDIASSININSLGVRNNIYSSSIGMIKYYYDKLALRGINYTMYENIREMIANKKSLLQDKILEDMKKYLENN